jgi:hypothetical protein
VDALGKSRPAIVTEAWEPRARASVIAVSTPSFARDLRIRPFFPLRLWLVGSLALAVGFCRLEPPIHHAGDAVRSSTQQVMGSPKGGSSGRTSNFLFRP